MATRYFCDRCEKEVNTSRLLKLVNFESDVQSDENNSFELCEGCKTIILRQITNPTITRPV